MMYLGNNPVGVNQVLLMNEIDDTAGIGDTNKTYSADKIARDLNSKLSVPSSVGSAGQVLTSDGENGQNWTTIVDSTLTEPGMAADAAATGAIKAILNDIATDRVESAQMIDSTKYVAGYMWNNGWDGDNYVGSTIDDDPVEDSFWTIVNQKWFLGEDKVIGFNYKTPNIQILCYTYDPQLEDYALYTTRTANNCTTDGDHYQLTLSDEIDAIRIFVASEWFSGLTDPIIMAMNADWDGNSTYGSSPASIRSDIQIAQVNSLRTELMSALLEKPSTAGTAGQVLVSDGEGGQVWGGVATDSTLSVSGVAADAAATGAVKSAVDSVKKIVSVTPTAITGLNFAANATSFETGSSYTVHYAQMSAGKLYRFVIDNAEKTTSTTVRFAISTSLPANGVSGNYLGQYSLVVGAKREIEYIPDHDLYFSVVSTTAVFTAGVTVSVTYEEGDIVIPLHEEVCTDTGFLSPVDFKQGSVYNGGYQYTNADCIAIKKLFAIDDSIDKVWFESLDTAKKWKIRWLFYDADMKILKTIGYNYYYETSIPYGAKYLNFAISPYQNDGTTAIKNITPSSVTANTLRVYFRKEIKKLTDYTESEFEQIGDNGYRYLHGEFINATLTSGNVHLPEESGYETGMYSVTSYEKFKFDHAVILTPDSGFKFGIHNFGTTGELFVSDSGWKETPYKIPANTYFRIIIRKVSADTTVYCDIPEHVKAVKVSTSISELNQIVRKRFVYSGAQMPQEHHIGYEFVTNLKMQPPTGTGITRQGAAVYNGYLFLAYNKHPMISVYNMATYELVNNIEFTPVDTYHCNNINFGSQKYDDGDTFPLLYVSMENIAEHKCLVYRIQYANSTFSATLVQTITYPDPETISAYYPNCILDNDNGVMYITSYTQNSYMATTANNQIRICKYTIPLLSEGDVTLNYAEKLDEFLIPAMTATQGAFVYNGKIIEVFGFTGSAFLCQIDPTTKQVVTKISLDSIGLTVEPESTFMYNGYIHIWYVYGDIYKLYFD